MPRWIALVVLLPALAFAVSCGGGDDDNDEELTPGPARTVSDEEYLAVLCTGLENFSDAINTAKTEEAIADVIKAWVVELKEVIPSEDLGPWHAEYTKYLEDAVDDPTSPLVIPAPLPPDGPRNRLNGKRPSVAECKRPTFFEPTATPAP